MSVQRQREIERKGEGEKERERERKREGEEEGERQKEGVGGRPEGGVGEGRPPDPVRPVQRGMANLMRYRWELFWCVCLRFSTAGRGSGLGLRC